MQMRPRGGEQELSSVGGTKKPKGAQIKELQVEHEQSRSSKDVTNTSQWMIHI